MTRLGCEVCAQINDVGDLEAGQAARCARCGSTIVSGPRVVVGRTLAFSVAALILYVPANTYPILSMRRLGAYSESTIWSGITELFSSGMWGIAIIVFVASILVPLLKLLGLFYLLASHRSSARRRYKTLVYKVIHQIGPWSMLDVFLVAILVGLVKLGDLASVAAEPGLIAFTGVVVLTMLASSSFDPRLIWQSDAQRKAKHP